MMHSWRSVLFGPDSLIEYIKYKNWVWDMVRKSYKALQFTQRKLERFFKEPVNEYTSQRADELFRIIICHWATIEVSKRAFELTLHRYRLTAPCDIEMAIFEEYSLLGNWIKMSCIASLAKAGFIYPKSKRVSASFI
jgi:hypothetical protein